MQEKYLKKLSKHFLKRLQKLEARHLKFYMKYGIHFVVTKKRILPELIREGPEQKLCLKGHSESISDNLFLQTRKGCILTEL